MPNIRLSANKTCRTDLVFYLANIYQIFAISDVIKVHSFLFVSEEMG